MHTGVSPNELQFYSTQTGADCKSLVHFTASEMLLKEFLFPVMWQVVVLQAFPHFLQPFSCTWLCKHSVGVYRKSVPFFLSRFFRALKVALDHHNNPRSLLCLLNVYLAKCSVFSQAIWSTAIASIGEGLTACLVFCLVVNFHKTCRNINSFTILSNWADNSQQVKYYLGVEYCKLKQETRLSWDFF